jgi:abortive infection bacteriophage resistance protein
MPLIPYNKQPLSFPRQIDLLVSRGLTVSDRPSAEAFLANTNYYRLSAYCIPFQSSRDVFNPGTTFENICKLYEFDRKIRLCVLNALERFEIAFRTIVANDFSIKHGPFAHMDAARFEPTFRHDEWLATLTTEINRSREPFITHFKAKYLGFPTLPIWMTVEVLSSGALSAFYSWLQKKDRTEIAAKYNLPEVVLCSWVRSLSYVRNVCAHHSRLWNRNFSVAPKIPRGDPNWAPPSFTGDKRVAAILFILNRLLRSLPNGASMAACWRADVENLLSAPVPVKDFEALMGLPANWKTHALWQK